MTMTMTKTPRTQASCGTDPTTPQRLPEPPHRVPMPLGTLSVGPGDVTENRRDSKEIQQLVYDRVARATQDGHRGQGPAALGPGASLSVGT